MSTIQAVVLAIVEGLTEFIPVSSTGHLIMISSLMGIGKDDFTQFFEIAVQMGFQVERRLTMSLEPTADHVLRSASRFTSRAGCGSVLGR